jgi:hypothetical protein
VAFPQAAAAAAVAINESLFVITVIRLDR